MITTNINSRSVDKWYKWYNLVLKDIEDSMVLNEDQKTAITGGNAVKLLGINVEGK